MTNRIKIRDKIVSLLKNLQDFGDGNVYLYKLDRVDKTPSASVYLGRMNSEFATMGEDANGLDRSLAIMVDFHSDDGIDADAQTSQWLEQLEREIYRSEKDSETEESLHWLVDDISLDFAEFRPTSTSGERRGDLVTVWRAEFQDIVAIS